MRSHEENRLKVCAPCGKKIILNGKKINFFQITSTREARIQNYVNSNYSKVGSKFPLSICNSCRIIFIEYEKDNRRRPVPIMPNYNDMQLSKSTRATGDICYCYICKTARSTNHVKAVVGQGHTRQFTTITDNSNGLYGHSNLAAISNSESSPDKNANTLKICKECLSEIGKGKTHKCESRLVLRENALKILERLPPTMEDQVVSNILKRKSTECSNTSELTLTSCVGHNTRIVVNPIKKAKTVEFTTESLDNFRVNTRSSLRQMKQVTTLIRYNVGRNAVPSNYVEYMSKNSKLMNHLYHLDELYFDTDSTEGKEKRPIVWANAEELLDYVVNERKLIGDINA